MEIIADCRLQHCWLLVAGILYTVRVTTKEVINKVMRSRSNEGRGKKVRILFNPQEARTYADFIPPVSCIPHTACTQHNS
jgi:hypothetical protein